MCGRYYVDDETAHEIEKLVHQIDEKLGSKSNLSNSISNSIKDIYPTNDAVVLRTNQKNVISDEMKWGLPGYQQKGVIFNARCESVLQKKMFSESVINRRCIIPARGFYEWDAMKNKITFERPDSKMIFMAGIWKPFEQNRFVILTTKANQSMAEVHDRMPLILEKTEINDWLFSQNKIDYFLHKIPTLLNIKEGFVQQSFLL